jgi:hypothetical protein
MVVRMKTGSCTCILLLQFTNLYILLPLYQMVSLKECGQREIKPSLIRMCGRGREVL